VDNSPEGAAIPACQRLAADAPVPLRFSHEPRPGVAFARNAAMAPVHTELVAFLDDDEEAPPEWLATLCAAREALDAHVVWGPVRVQTPGAETDARAVFLRQLLARTGPQENGPMQKFHGIGNALLVREALLPNPDPFPLESNEIGGEDDEIFVQAQLKGLRFGWAADAWVWEHIEPRRQTLAFGLRKALAFGAGSSSVAASQRNWLDLARHVFIGAGQMGVYGAAALIGQIVRSPQR
jgi:succinoglycan biosynthesis protein ExoM